MWRAKIITATQSKGLAFDIVVEFTDPDTSKLERAAFNGLSDRAQVDRVIANQLAQYEKVAEFDVSGLVGDWQAPDAPIIPTPSPEQERAQAYAIARGQLVALKTELDLGLVDREEYDKALELARTARAAALNGK